MAREDITQYTDQELSLRFMNEEPLYRAMLRCRSADALGDLAETYFIFTPEQLSELLTDWRDLED